MQQGAALRAAIDLLHVPSRVRAVRSEPLPDGVGLLIEIASGYGEALVEAVAHSERPQQVVEDSAAFFIEQILFSPDSDSYRVLGSKPEAEASELRRNMALLLRWLHPDVDRDGGRSVYAGRVTRAWEDLKTPQRRQKYDIERDALLAQLQGASPGVKRSHVRRAGIRPGERKMKPGYLRGQVHLGEPIGRGGRGTGLLARLVRLLSGRRSS